MNVDCDFIIEITQADIDAGVRGDGELCPAALATKRAIGRDDVTKLAVVPASHEEGDKLKEFMRRFDNGEPVEPWSYKIVSYETNHGFRRGTFFDKVTREVESGQA